MRASGIASRADWIETDKRKLDAMLNITPHFQIVLLACLLAASAGCEFHATGGEHISAAVIMGNRNINFEVDPAAQIQNADGATIVALENHEIRIEQDRLLLDGKEVVKFEPAVANVHLRALGGTLTVKADGKEVLNTKLPQGSAQ
jgi:hypothetical protein